MGNDGLSTADVLALNKENDGLFGGGSGGGIIILILFLLLAGGGGFGFGNGRNCASQGDVVNGFNFNQLDNGLRSIERGVCNLGYATLQQTQAINASINQLGYQNQQCCCETNRNIDSVRYDNERNTCAITNAIHNEGEQTRALMTANEVQKLRDENQSFRFQLSSQAQTAALIQALRPFPQPAYITCSPYMSIYGGCPNGGGRPDCGTQAMM